MRDFSDDIGALQQRLNDARTYLRIEELEARLPELEKEASKPDLWDDQDAAKKINSELAKVNDDLNLFNGLVQRLDDADTLAELAREAKDEPPEPELEHELSDPAKRLDEIELRSLCAGEHDERDALCTLSSGEGGADAQDWTEMLYRMYVRWAQRRGFEVEEEGST